MTNVILLVLIAVAIFFAAAFLYVSRIISLPPEGRAVDYLNSKLKNNQRVIACIGDSLTHGNIGQSWVDYLRKGFPNDVFLNEGINGNTVWQVIQRVDPILACKPDIVILMIGSNDAEKAAENGKQTIVSQEVCEKKVRQKIEKRLSHYKVTVDYNGSEVSFSSKRRPYDDVIKVEVTVDGLN